MTPGRAASRRTSGNDFQGFRQLGLELSRFLQLDDRKMSAALHVVDRQLDTLTWSSSYRSGRGSTRRAPGPSLSRLIPRSMRSRTPAEVDFLSVRRAMRTRRGQWGGRGRQGRSWVTMDEPSKSFLENYPARSAIMLEKTWTWSRMRRSRESVDHYSSGPLFLGRSGFSRRIQRHTSL